MIKKVIFSYAFDSFSLLFPFYIPIYESLPLLFNVLLLFKEYWDEFTLITLYKRVNHSFFVSKSLFRSQKTSDFLEKPKSEFSTLHLTFLVQSIVLKILLFCLKYTVTILHLGFCVCNLLPQFFFFFCLFSSL